ncbi:DUF6850 family outer membrane beta-barrel protein [Proteiniphilum sp. UBA5384]|uniref:DUF6850 family outer membrane beta-barrel protein n=1 Tax=Proteiniphilum sp. UBA5384 TaxID=1947279 RepID=UPI0025CC81D7|nr:DUF6850 family outer membrane beta-barrel protein [Proteiniphilum sp. UBA5384]
MKKGNSKYVKGGLAIVLAFQFIQYVQAQEQETLHSPASIELHKARSVWFDTGNSAGLVLDNLGNFGSIEAGYRMKSGDFKRVQQGDKESTLVVDTEGGRKLGETYLWGRFSYNRNTTRDSKFNTAMLDPYRGVPFFPVDPNISDWKKQDYNLEMKVSSRPFFDRYLFGLQAVYTTHTGAKQVDPRSEIYYYTINVKPGIVALLQNQELGVNFEYENMVQETRHTNSDSEVNQDVFVMKGLGNHYTSVIGGLQSLGGFKYDANKVGGELQYVHHFQALRLLAHGGYTYRVEDVIRDITKPRKEGSIKEKTLYGNLAMVYEGMNLHRVDFSVSSDRMSAIEYVQVLDNSFEVQQWVDVYSSIRSTYRQDDIRLSYDFYKGTDHAYQWKVGLFTNYRANDDLYIMPESKRNIKNLYMGVNGKVNMKAGASGSWTLGADFSYKSNLDGEYHYGGVDPESIVITQFMTPDFVYLAQDFYKLGGAVSYFTGIGNQKSGIFVKLAADYYKPSKGGGDRVIANLGAGVTF